MKFLMPISHSGELSSNNPTHAIVSINARQVSCMLDRIKQIQQLNPVPTDVLYLDSDLVKVECLIETRETSGCMSIRPILADPAGPMFDVQNVKTVFNKYGDVFSVYFECEWLDVETDEYYAEISSFSHELLLSLASQQIPDDNSSS